MPSRLARISRLALASSAAVALSVSAVHPASAAATASDSLKSAGTLAQPSVVMVYVAETGFIQDNSNGQTYGANGAGDTTPFEADFYGTGFFVSSDGYIVTAAHVAAPTDEMVKQDLVKLWVDQDAVTTGSCASGDGTCISNYENANWNAYLLAARLTENQVKVTVLTQNMTTFDQGLPAQVVNSSATDVGHDTAVLKINGSNEPVLPFIADSSKVQTQDDVAVIGYPANSDISTNLASALVPSITTGTISAIKQGPDGFAQGVTVFQTDAAVSSGNSGGPAIEADANGHPVVVGIVSFGNTTSTTTSYLIDSNDVKSTLPGSVNTTQGTIDHVWYQGLDYYNASHYKAAESDFKQCSTLNPVQTSCAHYDTLATQNFSKDVPLPANNTAASSSSSLPVGLIAGIAVAALIVILLVVFLVTRGKGKSGGTGSGGGTPMVAPPMQPPANQMPQSPMSLPQMAPPPQNGGPQQPVQPPQGPPTQVQ